MFFLKEQEFKYKNRNFNYDNLITEFFECYNLIKSFGIENN